MSFNLDRVKGKHSKEEPEKTPRYEKIETHSIGGKKHTEKRHTEEDNPAEWTTTIRDDINEPEIHKETTRVRNGFTLSRDTDERFFQNGSGIIERHTTEENIPPKIQIKEYALGNAKYKEEITATAFKDGKEITYHGINVAQLGCGHPMLSESSMGGICCVCGKTFCEQCGSIIEGKALCILHSKDARDILTS